MLDTDLIILADSEAQPLSSGPRHYAHSNSEIYHHYDDDNNGDYGGDFCDGGIFEAVHDANGLDTSPDNGLSSSN